MEKRQRKRAGRSISILLTLVMVLTTLMPSWAYGNESITGDNAASQASTQASTSTQTETTTENSESGRVAQDIEPTETEPVTEPQQAQKDTDTAPQQASEPQAVKAEPHYMTMQSNIAVDINKAGKEKDKPYLSAAVRKTVDGINETEEEDEIAEDDRDKAVANEYTGKLSLTDKDKIDYQSGQFYELALFNYTGNGSALKYIEIESQKITLDKLLEDSDNYIKLSNVEGIAGDAYVDVYTAYDKDEDTGKETPYVGVSVGAGSDAQITGDIEVKYVFEEPEAEDVSDADEDAKKDDNTDNTETKTDADAAETSKDKDSKTYGAEDKNLQAMNAKLQDRMAALPLMRTMSMPLSAFAEVTSDASYLSGLKVARKEVAGLTAEQEKYEVQATSSTLGANQVQATLSENAPVGSKIKCSWTTKGGDLKEKEVVSGKPTALGNDFVSMFPSFDMNELTVTVGTETDYQTYKVKIVKRAALEGFQMFSDMESTERFVFDPHVTDNGADSYTQYTSMNAVGYGEKAVVVPTVKVKSGVIKVNGETAQSGVKFEVEPVWNDANHTGTITIRTEGPEGSEVIPSEYTLTVQQKPETLTISTPPEKTSYLEEKNSIPRA